MGIIPTAAKPPELSSSKSRDQSYLYMNYNNRKSKRSITQAIVGKFFMRGNKTLEESLTIAARKSNHMTSNSNIPVEVENMETGKSIKIKVFQRRTPQLVSNSGLKSMVSESDFGKINLQGDESISQVITIPVDRESRFQDMVTKK